MQQPYLRMSQCKTGNLTMSSNKPSRPNQPLPYPKVLLTSTLFMHTHIYGAFVSICPNIRYFSIFMLPFFLFFSGGEGADQYCATSPTTGRRHLPRLPVRTPFYSRAPFPPFLILFLRTWSPLWTSLARKKRKGEKHIKTHTYISAHFLLKKVSSSISLKWVASPNMNGMAFIPP